MEWQKYAPAAKAASGDTGNPTNSLHTVLKKAGDFKNFMVLLGLMATVVALVLAGASWWPWHQAAALGCDCQTVQKCKMCSAEEVLVTMADHPDVPTVQANSCDALAVAARFGNWPGVNDTVHAAMDGVVAAMVRFLDEPRLQISCFGVLSELGKHGNTTVATMVRVGSIERVMAAMARFPDDSILQEKGCQVLSGLADYGSTAEVAAIKRVGGVERVMAALSRFPDDNGVQLHCSASLDGSRLGCSGGLFSDATCRQQCMGCAPEEVVRAMASFPDDPNVQENGLDALTVDAWNSVLLGGRDWHRWWQLIFWNGGRTRHKENAVQIVSAGGIERVIAAMARFPDDPRVQAKGCFTLGYVAKHGSTNEVAAIVNGEGIERVMVALTSVFLDDVAFMAALMGDKVQKEGAYALFWLAVRGKAADIATRGGFFRGLFYVALECANVANDLVGDVLFRGALLVWAPLWTLWGLLVGLRMLCCGLAVAQPLEDLLRRLRGWVFGCLWWVAQVGMWVQSLLIVKTIIVWTMARGVYLW